MWTREQKSVLWGSIYERCPQRGKHGFTFYDTLTFIVVVLRRQFLVLYVQLC